MGFLRDVRRIVSLLPKQRQSLLFSATMPPEIAKLVSEILVAPQRIDISPKAVTADRIEQNTAALALAEAWDNGKPIRETLNADLPLTVDHFRYFAAAIRAQEG